VNQDATKALLRARLGLCFEGPSEARLRAAITGRQAVLGLDAAAYLARLSDDAGELQTLAGLLTIKETYFYREPQHLRLLTEHLAPALLGGRDPGDPVRILSAGCATGEEPYSIAMALRERWGESAARLFHIAAVDLDREALATAGAGYYRPYALRALDPARTARWFGAAAAGTRRLAESLRRAVAFRPLNLVADPYPDDLRGQDLIFYRNLSIYFDAATREAVLRRLRTLLRPGGYLIVGLAETLANGFGLFLLCEHDGVWYFAKHDAGVAAPPAPVPESAAPESAAPARGGAAAVAVSVGTCPPADGSGTGRPGAQLRYAASGSITAIPGGGAGGRGPGAPAATSQDAPYQQALALAQAERFTSALAVLAPACAAPGAPPTHLRLLAHLLLERGDLAGAADAARRVLARDAWCPDALVLLGRIARAQGALGEAVAHLRRAIYERPDYWPAHLELAECRAAGGNPGTARREYRIALRLLEGSGSAAEQAGPLPAALPLADLRHLCRARLARLGDAA